MPLDQQLLAYLEKIGTRVKPFNQGDAWKSATAAVRLQYPAEGDDSPSSGYCRGACLDWLRRVLIKTSRIETPLSHFPAEKRNPPDGYEQAMENARQKYAAAEIQYQSQLQGVHGIAPGERRVERMAAAWARPYAAERDAANRQLEEQRQRIDKDLLADLQKLGCSKAYFEPGGDKRQLKYSYSKEIEASVKDRVAQWQRDLSQLSDRLSQPPATGKLSGVWDQQRTALDVAFRTKQGAPKGFGQLEILTSRGDGYRTYTGTQQFLCEALYLRTFVQGTGLLIGLNLEKWNGAGYVEGPGHAIAMHYQDPSTFVLFDPNLGVYSFKEQARALRAVLALVEEGYNTPQKNRPSTRHPGGDCYVFCDSGMEARLADYLAHPVLRESWATWKQSAESAPEAAALAGSNFAAERQEFRTGLLAAANSALLQARTAYTAYEANRTRVTQRAYVDANNLAVDACTRAGMTVDEGKRTWSQYDATSIDLK